MNFYIVKFLCDYPPIDGKNGLWIVKAKNKTDAHNKLLYKLIKGRPSNDIGYIDLAIEVLQKINLNMKEPKFIKNNSGTN